MRSIRTIHNLVFLALCTTSLAASAHSGGAHSHSSFADGFTHPLFGLDHLAAMVAVGLWSALSARTADHGTGRESRTGNPFSTDWLWGPLGFATLLLVGALLGLQGVALPALEPMIAASLLVTGLLVVARLRVPGAVAALGVGAFALFHGAAHGYELAGSDSAFATLAGMLTATVLLHASGLAAGWALRRSGSAVANWLARGAGAGVATMGGALMLQMQWA